MATIIEEVRPAGEGEPDPYRYGWRYREYRDADGTLRFEQIPLTIEDVLHPQEGDQVTHSNAHQRRRRYLVDVLEARLRHDPSAVVLDDVRIAWDIPDLGAHGPDIAVILGVREPTTNWRTFSVASEGVRPAIIFEITSPETAGIDRSAKLEEYELANVPLYVIVDGVSRRRNNGLRLLAYTLTPSGYEALRANDRGWLWLEPVRTWLGVADDEIICYDESEQPLGNYRALADALRESQEALLQAQHEVQAAAERVAASEARLRELEAELRRLRSDS